MRGTHPCLPHCPVFFFLRGKSHQLTQLLNVEGNQTGSVDLELSCILPKPPCIWKHTHAYDTPCWRLTPRGLFREVSYCKGKYSTITRDLKRALQANPASVHEWHGMNNVICFSLFITRVCNRASVGACAQMICHFCLRPNALIYSFVAFSFLLALFFPWGSSLEPMLIKNLGRRMTPWEWQMKRNQILPGTNCTPLIQTPATLSSSPLTSRLLH